MKDTYDFLRKVKQLQVPSEAFLFSLDVDSLYTNIDTPLGLKAVRDCFEKFPDASRPVKAILQLLELSLTKNDFEFEGAFYLQIKGTAMGKRFAPSYANIYMAQWEETLFPKCPKLPLCYLRFLDDVWGVCHHGLQEFQIFLQVLNSHHASIKVKSVIDKQAIDFLDTTVYKGLNFHNTGQLDFKVFFQGNGYARTSLSSQLPPRHTFRGIVLAQLVRFRRICSQEDSFQRANQVLFRALRQRGYSRSLLRAIYKEHCESSANTVAQSSQSETERVPVIFTFSSAGVGLAGRVRGNFSQTLANTIAGGDFSLLAAYKHNTNLRDLLVHSRKSLY